MNGGPRALGAILLDIEGTTTAVEFVKDVLFPHAAAHLPRWIGEFGADPSVRECLEEVSLSASAEGTPVGSDAERILLLTRWMKEDRKHPALKRLQGYVWRAGYESRAFEGHVYPDVPACLSDWKSRGLTLAVYSSGSVEAQRLLFRHSSAGDLTGLFSRYFDATIGGKREAESYAAIRRELGFSANEILFLSDTEAELDAAAQTGMQTIQIVRGDLAGATRHPVAADFVHVGRRLALGA